MRQFKRKALSASMLALGLVSASYSADIVSVTASKEGKNIAENVLDGRLSTRWSAKGEQWLQFELAELSTITAMDIAFYKGDKRQAYFEIQSSEDGDNWDSLFDGISSGQSKQLETIDITEAVGQYVRIIASGNTKNSWNAISEVQISSTSIADDNGIDDGSPDDSSISDTVSVEVITAVGDDGNQPENVMDDDLSTRWSVKGTNKWLQFELVEQTVITDIDIAFYKGNSRFAYFELQASSDAEQWQTIFSGTSSGETSALENFAVTYSDAKYIRFIGNGNSENMWNSISEVVLHSAEGATVPEDTEPEVTEPEITDPEVTDPEDTEPEITDPEVTEPEDTEPEITDPEITDPSGSTDLWSPTPNSNLTWDWRIGDTPDPESSTYYDVYDIDLFDNSAEDIAAFQARGMTVICYFSAGTYEGWRDDWQEYFSFITTDSYSGDEAPFAGNMSDWDERWLDVREIELLEPIMRGRMAMAKDKGCDAVEPDNMDSYTNQSEVDPDGTLTAADQIAYNKAIAEWAHDEGLSVGLKNDVDQIDSLVDYFDWALNEQCYQYNECDGYQLFIDQNKAVFGVEYSGTTSSICEQANADGYYWLKKTLALTEYREGCEDYE